MAWDGQFSCQHGRLPTETGIKNADQKEFEGVVSGNLVGGLEHFFYFHILGIMIPTDQYFSEGLVETTNQ